MRFSNQWTVLWLILIAAAGCTRHPNAGHGHICDAIFGRRHKDHVPHVEDDSLLALAREITILEDDIRRDGSITVKAPDVWGDGNLMHYIQEYDVLLADSVDNFAETIQAYIARSDQMELQSATALGVGTGGTPAPTAPDATFLNFDGDLTSTLSGGVATGVAATTKKGIGVEPTELERQRSAFIYVNQALRRRNMGDDNSRAAGYGLYKFRVPVSVLPGRETHEGHSAVVTMRARLEVDAAHLKYTFPKLVIADLVQTLSPHLLDTWSADVVAADKAAEWATVAAGAAQQAIEAAEALLQAAAIVNAQDVQLKLEKAQGEVGIALVEAFDASDAVRARIKFDRAAQAANHALSAAETAREAAELIGGRTEIGGALLQIRNIVGAQADTAGDASEQVRQLVEEGDVTAQAGQGIPITVLDPKKIYRKESIASVRAMARDTFREQRPKTAELRAWLFAYFGQVHNVLRTKMEYTNQGLGIAAAGQAVAIGDISAIALQRLQWVDELTARGADEEFANASWILAVQTGIVNENLKKILEELKLKNRLSEQDSQRIRELQFFNTDVIDGDTNASLAVRLWEILIQEEFPIHVFALDPQVEEQNVYDAFSRRREMQLALAISVAGGSLNAGQKVAMSRQLGLDMTSIALNRTAVAFSHGNDTFGWYFYPRVQSPPIESSNIGALARMIWSTGPTDCYDMKHRKIEPGIRECEVLVAMPSFVTQVAFDVTTNWEKVARPGVTLRSYEEMIAQGGRLETIRRCMGYVSDAQCYRPGDYARLISRVDQLEHMLGLQTHVVRVPYEYEIPGTELFDSGDVHLRPELHDYYGLDFVESNGGQVAYIFLTGRNFHPTLTHVIIGGAESHALRKPPPEDDSAAVSESLAVEVISRELLRVEIPKLIANLSRDRMFTLRVGTPAGVSDPLEIPSKELGQTRDSTNAGPTEPPLVNTGGLAGHSAETLIRLPPSNAGPNAAP